MFIPPITVIVGFDPFPCWLFKGLLVLLLHDFVSAFALTCASDERTIMGNQTRGQGRRSDPVNPCDIFHNHHKIIWYDPRETREIPGFSQALRFSKPPPKEHISSADGGLWPSHLKSSRHDAARHGATDPDLPWLQLFWGEHQPWDKGHGPHHGIWCLGNSFPRWAKRAK